MGILNQDNVIPALITYNYFYGRFEGLKAILSFLLNKKKGMKK